MMELTDGSFKLGLWDLELRLTINMATHKLHTLWNSAVTNIETMQNTEVISNKFNVYRICA